MSLNLGTTALDKETSKSLPLNIDFTYNVWGEFSLGDGETFNTPSKDSRCDWFIYCERVGDVFYTTFIPNPNNLKTKDDICEDMYDVFLKEATYKTTFDDIRGNLMKSNMVAVSRDEVINITDFDFYYMGILGNNISEETEIGQHSKYNELIKTLNL